MPNQKPQTTDLLHTAERLRSLLSRWVRTTRDEAGTPSSAKIETLRLLQNEGPLAIAALAQRRSVKHQSMRVVVQQLALEGSVQKKVDPADRRSQLISITTGGRTIVRQNQLMRAKWIASLLAACTAVEREQVVVAIGVLDRLLGKTHKL